MIPILILNNPDDFAITPTSRGANVTPSLKAFKVEFQRANGQVMPSWVPVSQSKVEAGLLWVAEWLLEPNRDGIGALAAAGHKCLSGTVIPDEVKPTGTFRDAYVPSPIHKGFFTVVADGEKHRTFKFKTGRNGKTAIGLLTGANNTEDYTFFGYVDGNKIRFWRNPSFNGMPTRLHVDHDVLNECLAAILGDVNGAGLRYAMESEKCSRCGRDLTVPASICNGLGPVCDGLGYARKEK